ncbi:MAG TPA: histidine-type phosphatase [Streptosporangiaceae bacterium]|nr:histidine-type phosphatase [Streptosporangiaceae bacterium]
MRRSRLFAPAIAVAAVAALCGAVAAPAQAGALRAPAGRGGPWGAEGNLIRIAETTKASYQPQSLRQYQPPPRGFQPVFTENVQRHGDRTDTSSSDGDELLALWQIAQADAALTPLGRGLGPELQQFESANAAIGYGNLAPDGVTQIEAIAKRMYERLPSLFDSASSSAGAGNTTERIEVVSASQERTTASAAAFVAGLESEDPGLAPVIGPTQVNNNLLYFHKAAINQDYQNYVASNPDLLAAEAYADNEARSHEEATAMLERSFTPAFVQEIAAGDFSAEFVNEVDAATALYDVWSVSKDLSDEGPWTLGRYLTPQQASCFGYLDDVDSFYENGPAFLGNDITYAMAGVLLDDMFAQIQAKADGTSQLIAVLRFTHAEEIFPLATLLGLPGSTKQEPVGTEYTYAGNPFRGANVAPMAANIQWDVFSDGSTYLVRMLYNEKQTAFKAGCTPIAKGSYYYNLTELEQCYDWSPSDS